MVALSVVAAFALEMVANEKQCSFAEQQQLEAMELDYEQQDHFVEKEKEQNAKNNLSLLCLAAERFKDDQQLNEQMSRFDELVQSHNLPIDNQSIWASAAKTLQALRERKAEKMQEHEKLRQMGLQQQIRRSQLLSNKRGISDAEGEFVRRKRSLTTPGPAKNVRGKTFYDQIRRQPPHHFDVTILPYTMQRIEKTAGKVASTSDERDDSQLPQEPSKTPSPEPVHPGVIVQLHKTNSEGDSRQAYINS